MKFLLAITLFAVLAVSMTYATYGLGLSTYGLVGQGYVNPGLNTYGLGSTIGLRPSIGVGSLIAPRIGLGYGLGSGIGLGYGLGSGIGLGYGLGVPAIGGISKTVVY